MDFSKKDLQLINSEINAAEEKTSAEIVVVVAPQSDDYRYVPLLWGALLAFFVPIPLYVYGTFTGPEIYLFQLLSFCILATFLSLPFILMHVVPRKLQRRRAHKRAMEQFLTQNLHTTKGRTGILIFVSTAEKYCEIIADDGIYQKLKRTYWEDQIRLLSGMISKGETIKGFVTVIRTCGKDLAKHYPAGSENPNELPNHIILL